MVAAAESSGGAVSSHRLVARARASKSSSALATAARSAVRGSGDSSGPCLRVSSERLAHHWRQIAPLPWKAAGLYGSVYAFALHRSEPTKGQSGVSR